MIGLSDLILAIACCFELAALDFKFSIAASRFATADQFNGGSTDIVDVLAFADQLECLGQFTRIDLFTRSIGHIHDTALEYLAIGGTSSLHRHHQQCSGILRSLAASDQQQNRHLQPWQQTWLHPGCLSPAADGTVEVRTDSSRQAVTDHAVRQEEDIKSTCIEGALDDALTTLVKVTGNDEDINTSLSEGSNFAVVALAIFMGSGNGD